MIADPLVVVPIEPLVASIASLEFLVVHVPGERHPGDHEVITAQNFADAFDNVRIETANRRPDRNHRRHADDNPDKSQKSPQFVGKDRLQSNLQGVGIKGQNGFHNSDLGRYTRPAPAKFNRGYRVKTFYVAGVLTGVSAGLTLNLSAQRIRPVICMTTKSVRTEPMVMASPVKPFRKNA